MTIFNKGMVKNCKKKSKNKASNSESFDGTFRQIDFRKVPKNDDRNRAYAKYDNVKFSVGTFHFTVFQPSIL